MNWKPVYRGITDLLYPPAGIEKNEKIWLRVPSHGCSQLDSQKSYCVFFEFLFFVFQSESRNAVTMLIDDRLNSSLLYYGLFPRIQPPCKHTNSKHVFGDWLSCF